MTKTSKKARGTSKTLSTKIKSKELEGVQETPVDKTLSLSENTKVAPSVPFIKDGQKKVFGASLEKVSNNFVQATLAVVLFVTSLLYFNNGVVLNSFFKGAQLVIYFILGFLHGYAIYRLKSFIQSSSVFNLVCYTFIYTAWYNAVLLPESGLGFLEWGFVFFVLLMNFLNSNVTKKVNKVFLAQDPISLILFGFLLYIAKSFLFYMTDSNIYDSMFLGNTTARVFILGVILICATMAIKMSLNKTAKIEESKASKLKNAIVKGFGAIKNAVVGFLSTCAMPVLIAVIAVSAIFVLFFCKSVIDDIEKFFEPILEKILSTGKNTIQPNSVYGALQFSVFAGVVFYTAFINNKLLKKSPEPIASV